ncbi:hypothetical protein BH10BAC4_BH10BAC4_06790 [soil metagenome]
MKKLLATSILLLAMVTLLNAQTKESVKYINGDGSSTLPFSQAVRVGNILYLSGQIGSKPAGGLVEGGIGPETRQIMENIKVVLEQNGSSMDKVIKCTCMLADIGDWAKMNAEYVKYFTKHKPARSSFGTSGLAMGAKAEIECMASID